MIGAFLGTIYSVPPFQFKRVPLLAGGIIATVRGFLLNFGVYYAVREALGISFAWNHVVSFIASFMTVFASVIAVTKDLPDIDGDKKYNIDTLAAKYGVKVIATGAAAVLSLAYSAAIALPFIMKGTFKVLPMSGAHTLFLAYFLYSFSQLQPDKMDSINAFYKAIWNLFYLEYCIYPFI
jgi:homogentisate solanesyltransferase